MEQKYFESLYPSDVRSSEIEKLLRFVKEGNSCQIVSFPGVGRANLLGFLTYNRHVRIKHLGAAQTQYHFVMVHFAEVKKRPLFDVMKFLFLSLVDSLRERGMEEEYGKVNEIFKESLPFQDELVLFQGLKRTIDFLAVEKDLRLIFLFDRFEEYIPTVASEFFSNLRSIRNRAKYHFSVVFSLSRPLEDMLEPILFADFYEFVAGHSVYLSIFDRPGINFRIGYLEKITGEKLPQETKDEIVRLTGGHGKLTRLSVEAVLARHSGKSPEATHPESINVKRSWTPLRQGFAGRASQAVRGSESPQARRDDEGIEEFLLSQKTVQGALFEIWYSLTPSEQKTLVSPPTTLPPVPLVPPVIPAKAGIKILDQVENDIPYLQDVGLVADGKVTIPLFASFLSTIVASQSEAPEQIFYDDATNTIKKGEITLSDTLTAAEFRLFKHLIANKEKVIDREEIITVVWKDAKSTAGVTDQAIDQLIFRLRKKIEENPNNPTHLQTVKGRGFKFVT